jgi:prolyl-tRNA synthetase
MKVTNRIYDELTAAGVDVLMDDRDQRPGFKFKDADLIGIPLRITIGGKGLAEGIAEVKWRTEADPKKVALAETVGFVKDLIAEKQML